MEERGREREEEVTWCIFFVPLERGLEGEREGTYFDRGCPPEVSHGGLGKGDATELVDLCSTEASDVTRGCVDSHSLLSETQSHTQNTNRHQNYKSSHFASGVEYLGSPAWSSVVTWTG